MGDRPPISLAHWGSFHLGGRETHVIGADKQEVLYTPGGAPWLHDPNGHYQVGGLYAQFMVPDPVRGAAPLMLWHGGGLTGACWETTPDSREGWQHFFLRRGWEVIVSDAVERGRAGWTRIPQETGSEPIHTSIEEPWRRFRVGAGVPQDGVQLPGNQFPGDAASWRNFARQNVPRFTGADDLTLAAYVELLDRTGPAVVVAHSQGGYFAWRAAQERPEKVRALVLLEPAAPGLADKIGVLADIPVLMIFGDYIEGDPRWSGNRRKAADFADALRAAGGAVEICDLPAAGLMGNSHMIMMDRNSDAVAGLAQDWLAAKGLWR